MNKHTILATALLTLGLGIGLSTSTQITSAKSSVKIIKTHHMSNALTGYSFNGNIYSSRYLKKVTHKGYNYPKTKWSVNYSAKVKKSNGKAGVYYNIKNGKVKGWIWKGYLSDKPQVKKAAQYKNAGRTINGVKLNANGVAILPKAKKVRHNYKGSNALNPKKYLPLSIPVSNTNVYGYKKMDTYRKYLLRFKDANKNSNEKKEYQSYYLDYESIVSGNAPSLNVLTQNDVNNNITDLKYAVTH